MARSAPVSPPPMRTLPRPPLAPLRGWLAHPSPGARATTTLPLLEAPAPRRRGVRLHRSRPRPCLRRPTFAARTGLEAAEATAELGFAVGGGEVSGALVSAGLTEDDLAAGLYDDAARRDWLVNWAAPAERLLLDVASIGEIRRADGAFVAELRGIMHRLDEERGRLYRADLRGRSRRREMRRRPRRRGVHRDGAVTATDGALSPRGGGSRPLPRAGSRAASSSGSPAPMPGSRPRSRRIGSRRRGRARPLAARRAPDRRRRHVPGHRRLRQALLHLPGRNSPTSRISAASRTCRATISSCASPARASRAWTAGACSDEPGRNHRRGAELDRHALSPSGLAQGRRLRLPRASARCLA